jgi:outer membrane protein OmpA-like peptidoglycan-associated protein
LKRYAILFIFALVGLAASPAQTAAEIEVLLDTQAVTYAQAARFVLEAAEAAVIADPAEAFQFAAENNWLPKDASPETTARLDGISLLFMRSFDLRGGFFYSLMKNPHYAYRELVYQAAIQGRADPHMAVSGYQLIFMTNRIFSIQEEAAGRKKAQQLVAQINAIIQARGITDVYASVVDEGVMISLSNFQFVADSAELQESEKEKLQEIAQILIQVPGRKIRIVGHTALAGTEEGRITLSLERAQAVASYFVSLGARQDSEITTMGYGAEQPIADNATAAGMERNRRVEIIILEN